MSRTQQLLASIRSEAAQSRPATKTAAPDDVLAGLSKQEIYGLADQMDQFDDKRAAVDQVMSHQAEKTASWTPGQVNAARAELYKLAYRAAAKELGFVKKAGHAVTALDVLFPNAKAAAELLVGEGIKVASELIARSVQAGLYPHVPIKGSR